jgi:hypothetical protein
MLNATARTSDRKASASSALVPATVAQP